MSEIVLPKGQDSFKLNEVCKVAKVQPYMLRFWATEFPGLEAEKSGTGQRLYNRDQVERILEIRRLLFDEGLTIAGAKKRLAKASEASEPEEKPAADSRAPKKKAKKAKPAPKESHEPAVDKKAGDRVQRLLLALREVRDEVSALADELEK